ncbi:MAG: type IV toxin-antitoxin system AbiEi family antitoxin domain-containing protein [Propionibacteriaceae bacterium]|nr:type IV toxin-antitoxin system AbiEi family antitoxin domain-containing protein [Propionibacteriaceae bacterium]
MTIREELWEVALDQYGYVTTIDTQRLGIPSGELIKLRHRGKLIRAAQGVYRFPEYPVSPRGQMIEAVLWTRDPLAVLSHDTTLDVYELSDINPNVIHVTVPKREKPIRRKDTPAVYVIHYQDLRPDQRYYWEQIPCVTVETAIDQSITARTRPDLIAQAIEQARERGLIDRDTAARQRSELERAFS